MSSPVQTEEQVNQMSCRSICAPSLLTAKGPLYEGVDDELVTRGRHGALRRVTWICYSHLESHVNTGSRM